MTSFSVPENSLGYWMKRLDKFGVEYTRPAGRFGTEEFICFEDGFIAYRQYGAQAYPGRWR